MARAKSHQIEYVNEALASLFHSSPESFLGLLQRDGTKLLRFYWDKAGQRVLPGQRRDSFGLNYVLRTPQPNTGIAVITLPAPQFPGEAYLVALVYRPQRRLLLVSDTTHVFTLEAVDLASSPPETVLVEWSRRGQRQALRARPSPDVESFYTAVLYQIGE